MNRGSGIAGAVANAVGFAALSGVLLATATVIPYGGLGLLVLAPLVARDQAPPGRRLGPTARPLAAIVAAPALLVMPVLMAPDPVVRSHFACGTAAMAAVVMLPVAAFFGGVLAGATGLGFAAVAPRVIARLAAPLRLAAILVVGALLIAGAARWARRPSPEAWVDHLPITATVVASACSSSASGAPEVAPGEAPPWRKWPTARLELPQGSRTALAGCTGDDGGAWVELGDAGAAPLTTGLGRLHVPAGEIELRAHSPSGIVVLTQGGRAVGALDAADGRVVDVRLRTIAAEVAPPGLALLAAAVSLAIGVRQARRAARERTAAATVERAEEATIDDTGVVSPSGGGDPFRPPGSTLPAGPAVVLARPHTGPFRGGGDRGTWVLAGPRRDHVEAHRARAVTFDLEATAALAVGAAPLVAAALIGLVL